MGEPGVWQETTHEIWDFGNKKIKLKDIMYVCMYVCTYLLYVCMYVMYVMQVMQVIYVMYVCM